MIVLSSSIPLLFLFSFLLLLCLIFLPFLYCFSSPSSNSPLIFHSLGVPAVCETVSVQPAILTIYFDCQVDASLRVYDDDIHLLGALQLGWPDLAVWHPAFF